MYPISREIFCRRPQMNQNSLFGRQAPWETKLLVELIFCFLFRGPFMYTVTSSVKVSHEYLLSIWMLIYNCYSKNIEVCNWCRTFGRHQVNLIMCLPTIEQWKFIDGLRSQALQKVWDIWLQPFLRGGLRSSKKYHSADEHIRLKFSVWRKRIICVEWLITF